MSDNPETTNEFPASLSEALDRIPASYQVGVRRVEHDGGWWMNASRKQQGGEFRVTTSTYPLWQQAFAELWGKI